MRANRYRDDPEYREQQKARSRARYEAKKEQIKAYVAQWQKTMGKERARLYQVNRRGNGRGYLTVESWKAREAYYGGLCWMCGGPADSVDHVIPRGPSHPSNIRPICRPCNARKSNKPYSEIRPLLVDRTRMKV